LEDVVDLRQLILVGLGIARFVENLLGFFSQNIDFALTCRNHSLDVLGVYVVNVSDTMVPVFSHCAPEAHTYLAVTAVTFDILTRMLSACLVSSALPSGLHNAIFI
jgi:hypothetical protein